MISPAFAQAATGGAFGGDFLGPLVPFVLIAVVFYFLLIRPQQKRLKEHRTMIEAVKKGDMIVTSGGLIGKVLKVEEAEVQVELGEGVKVRVVRATIAEVRSKGEPVKASVAAKAKTGKAPVAKPVAANTDDSDTDKKPDSEK